MWDSGNNTEIKFMTVGDEQIQETPVTIQSQNLNVPSFSTMLMISIHKNFASASGCEQYEHKLQVLETRLGTYLEERSN